MNMKAAEPGVEKLFPSHSSRGFAAGFLGSATQTPTKPPATQANVLVVLAILFFATSAVRISLPSVFCILDILLIQVYKRSGTTHRFVAVVLQILFVIAFTSVPWFQVVAYFLI